jgi:hypothetical protein
MSEVQTDVHPDHPVPDEVAKGIEEYRDARWRLDDEAFELARHARPSAEERQFNADLRDRTLAAGGLDSAQVREARSRFADAHIERLTSRASPFVVGIGDLLDVDLHTAAPLAGDPNFWYASGRMFADPPFTAAAESDGIVFRGMKNHDSGDLIKLRFGWTFAYELQAERVPPSATGRWRSAPHAEIFGRLIGSSQDSLGFGDDWCKCWMVRRQTAFQFVFAPPGASNRRIIGERVDAQEIFFSEDAPFYRDWYGRGFQPMPELILTHPFPAQSIWVDLELRFDIQLEGSAQLWIWPNQRFVMRGFQWPAQPL